MRLVLGQIYAPFYYPELTTHRRENKKNRHENEILKANEPICLVTSDLSNDTKNIPQNLVRLFP
jgi:hypothetical protein